MATTTHAAGLKFIRIPGDAAGPANDAAMWSPCASGFDRIAFHKTFNADVFAFFRRYLDEDQGAKTSGSGHEAVETVVQ
ncbi:hypothetical protein [Mesorhizobium sp. B2-1-3A]|uniref:hypothetical protein n=1 Tax=Mesorhizobium sp. B2-1-3A TaxID=2589971 RepID=UPI00112A3C43|nr:hypothetical protein [Mesorhizobium sp. B2-1-3A]TPM92076.1 hypothetical protein FJ977_30220 [Mesorhizobium sp. B2-1-3A]